MGSMTSSPPIASWGNFGFLLCVLNFLHSLQARPLGATVAAFSSRYYCHPIGYTGWKRVPWSDLLQDKPGLSDHSLCRLQVLEGNESTRVDTLLSSYQPCSLLFCHQSWSLIWFWSVCGCYICARNRAQGRPGFITTKTTNMCVCVCVCVRERERERERFTEQ